MCELMTLICIGMGALFVSATEGNESIVAPDASAAQTLPEALRDRGLVNMGDPLRIQRALAKARRGEPVVVGVIGGSITQGAAATTEENRWGNRVGDWWKRTFPQSSVLFVNAGIGATGSDLGACRVERDLLSKNPDFVVVEFAVNDSGSPICVETMEGLLRQILLWPTQPGCMLLYTMNDKGQNMQPEHERVARYYGLPAVSFRDALWPEVEAGRVAWKDIEADAVHPNDKGHAYCSELVVSVLEKALKAMPQGDLPACGPLPKPMTSELFQHTRMITSDTAKPLEQKGWSAQPGHNRFGPGWTASEPGATLQIEVEGTCVALAYHHVRGDVGTIEARVDNGEPVTIDAYFPEDWGGGYTPFKLLARDLAPGKHVLNIRLLDKTHPESHGHVFNIDSICLAGVQE